MTNDPVLNDLIAAIVGFTLFWAVARLVKRLPNVMSGYYIRSVGSLLLIMLGLLISGWVIKNPTFYGNWAILGGSLLVAGLVISPNHWSGKTLGFGPAAQTTIAVAGLIIGITIADPRASLSGIAILVAVFFLGLATYLWAEDRHRLYPVATQQG